jgi:predicted N-acetyltransferase YhbS
LTELVSLNRVPAEAVEQLLDDAFGQDRHSRTAYLLRIPQTEIAALSFAILDGTRLTGSIQCWPIKLENTRLVLVGPVAVTPDRQGTGLGKQLMQAMLDPEYYGRFGFSAEQTGGWTLPGPWEPRRLLARNVSGQSLPETGMLERDDAL